jgi:hypothetical protein
MSHLDNMLKRESFEQDIQLQDHIRKSGINSSHSEVNRYWNPEAFEWLKDTRPLAIISKNTITLTEAAIMMTDFTPGDIINIGVNKAFIAFRKDLEGLTAAGTDDEQKSKGIQFKGHKMQALLSKKGYSLPCQLVCCWDSTNNMLVASRPIGNKETDHEESGRKNTRDTNKVQRRRNPKI